MKVATLTLPLKNNYGGIIQAFALQNAIENLGYETKLINMSSTACRPTHKALFSIIKKNVIRFISSAVFWNKKEKESDVLMCL